MNYSENHYLQLKKACDRADPFQEHQAYLGFLHKCFNHSFGRLNQEKKYTKHCRSHLPPTRSVYDLRVSKRKILLKHILHLICKLKYHVWRKHPEPKFLSYKVFLSFFSRKSKSTMWNQIFIIQCFAKVKAKIIWKQRMPSKMEVLIYIH